MADNNLTNAFGNANDMTARGVRRLVVVSDVNGTLFREGEIDVAFLKALLRLKIAGHEIFIASGAEDASFTNQIGKFSRGLLQKENISPEIIDQVIPSLRLHKKSDVRKIIAGQGCEIDLVFDDAGYDDWPDMVVATRMVIEPGSEAFTNFLNAIKTGEEDIAALLEDIACQPGATFGQPEP